MDPPVEKSDTPIDVELLEKLSHPIRQQILVIIERERKTGYRNLKEECKVSTGTLYHHLKILRGLIEQDDQKKYLLTEEGEQALAYLFQDTHFYNPPSVYPTADVAGPFKGKKIPKSTIYPFFHLPRVIYGGMIAGYLVLLLVNMLITPETVFFHFIPLEIPSPGQYWLRFLPIFWLCVTVFFMVCVSWTFRKQLTLAVWAWLTAYHSIIEVVIILLYLLPGMNSRSFLLFLSFTLQAVFLILFTIILAFEFCTWEQALLIALLINYLVLLLLLL